MIYLGKCFCGGVELRAAGEPLAMGYCHCASCRLWSASPVNAFTLWKPKAIEITRGHELVGVYHRTNRSHRRWCKACGGHLMTEHPVWDLIDVYAALLPELAFKPGVHVNYQDHVLRMA